MLRRAPAGPAMQKGLLSNASYTPSPLGFAPDNMEHSKHASHFCAAARRFLPEPDEALAKRRAQNNNASQNNGCPISPEALADNVRVTAGQQLCHDIASRSSSGNGPGAGSAALIRPRGRGLGCVSAISHEEPQPFGGNARLFDVQQRRDPDAEGRRRTETRVISHDQQNIQCALSGSTRGG
jgi:hypothetical protein